jgi:hypothetical protein
LSAFDGLFERKIARFFLCIYDTILDALLDFYSIQLIVCNNDSHLVLKLLFLLQSFLQNITTIGNASDGCALLLLVIFVIFSIQILHFYSLKISTKSSIWSKSFPAINQWSLEEIFISTRITTLLKKHNSCFFKSN